MHRRRRGSHRAQARLALPGAEPARRPRLLHFGHAQVQGPLPGVVGGTGVLLSALEPSRGVGLNLCDELTERARARFPALEFYTVDVDQVTAPEAFRPDYVILTNMLDYVYDIWDLLESLRPWVSERTL